MRIGLVSAHYPPNFVSGGTLVPHRLAAGLRDRGHEVVVFAGRLDADEQPLTVRDETGPDGTGTTWVNITPFTGWDDPRNHDNPEVAQRFRTWLQEARPAVVHFHALQTFGGSLVSEAADAGCRTIVTMHDFWWFCSRQFLVDRAMRPCSLVVDAGVCDCHNGRAALDARTAALAPHLARADLVLAPSTITADVLRANGVAAERLRVNENGMVDATVPARPDRTGSDTVRFRYTGGADPMKGAEVLAEAIGLLDTPADRGRRWHLTVHADDPSPGLQRAGSHPNVTVTPPYGPDELDDVFATTDVLVLPSVMRETHSIVTRESMMRGVPVITSDSLGPEQVVVDGENGLVVRTADAAALADAVRRVTDDAALLERLRQGCDGFSPRTIETQLDEIESFLEADRPADDEWTPGRVAFVVGIDGAPLRYRSQFPAEALELLGIDCTVLHYSDPGVEDAMASADAIVVYRVPATPRVLALVDAARDRGVPVAFDVDDLIVDPTIEAEIPALRILPPEEARLWMEGVQRYRTTLEHCDAYIGSTSPLVDRVRTVTGLPCHVKPNGYGLHLAKESDAALRTARDPGPPRIGYLSGTTTHDEDFRSVLPALISVLRDTDAELWLGGHLPDDPRLEPFGSRVVRMPFRPWNELPALLRQLDVNLAPLADRGHFNEAKSAIKWLEAALVETPTIASATTPFAEAITPGVDGLLIDDAADWEPAIRGLIDDAVTREAMGSAARRTALLAWSPHLQGARMLEILRAVRASVGASRASTWTDVANEEPAAPGPVALSPYPPSVVAAPPVDPVVSQPGFVERVRWSLRNESPRTIAARAVRRVRAVVRR